jgi:hypothetical protein
MDKDSGFEIIREMIADGESKMGICEELKSQGVPNTTAYRWVNELLPQRSSTKSAGLEALEAAQHVLYCAIAEEDHKKILDASKTVATIEKALLSR